MNDNSSIFMNSEGIGGFEQGLYDNKAAQPTGVNWTRQSCFSIPDNPKLVWKVSKDNAYLGGTQIGGSFVISKDKTVIVSESSNNIFCNDGKLLEISKDGIIKELFTYDKKFGLPVIGMEGIIYIYTIGAMASTGHKLFCLSPEGKIIWEYFTDYRIGKRPVIDKDGNIYFFTYGDRNGTLLCLTKDGNLKWKYQFNSINWCDPVITVDEIIYIGLNVTKTLCAFNKSGKLLWEKPCGLGLGTEFMNIKNDGTIYVYYDGALHALLPNGNVKWAYQPDDSIIEAAPALDKNGRLYLNRTPNLLVSLDSEGNELWSADTKDTVLQPPIIGDDGKIMQISYIEGYPLDKSWIQVFTSEGDLLWEYEIDGIIMSAYLADNNLIYVATNIYSKKKVRWEIHAIGEA